MDGFLTDSQVANRWLLQGRQAGLVQARREDILENLEGRFPGQVTDEIRNMVNQQGDAALLNDWFKATCRATSLDDFLRHLHPVTRFVFHHLGVFRAAEVKVEIHIGRAEIFGGQEALVEGARPDQALIWGP